MWSRDLYQVATAFLAIGDKESADRALNYLFTVQQNAANGSGNPVTVRAIGLVSRSAKSTDPSTWTNHVGPIGLFLGRLANFINSELWGRTTDASVPWAVVFPNGGPLPRHPSQLYEAALEGINRLKKLVPIWKKEHFEDGEVWVEGEWDQNVPLAG